MTWPGKLRDDETDNASISEPDEEQESGGGDLAFLLEPHDTGEHPAHPPSATDYQYTATEGQDAFLLVLAEHKYPLVMIEVASDKERRLSSTDTTISSLRGAVSRPDWMTDNWSDDDDDDIYSPGHLHLTPVRRRPASYPLTLPRLAAMTIPSHLATIRSRGLPAAHGGTARTCFSTPGATQSRRSDTPQSPRPTLPTNLLSIPRPTCKLTPSGAQSWPSARSSS